MTTLTLLDIHHRPLIHHIITLLSSADVLALECTCRGLRTAVRSVPGSYWWRRLQAELPRGHALLDSRCSSFTPAKAAAYFSIRQGLCGSPRHHRWVWREQDLITHSFAPDGSLLCTVSDAGGFQGVFKLYEVPSGRLLQSCTLSPLWTMPDDCNVMPDERVQWAADSENGIVLVPARGHNLVVSFGTCHLAVGQYNWDMRWRLSHNGRLLACWKHKAQPDEPSVHLLDRNLREILWSNGGMTQTTYTAYGQSLQKMAGPLPPERRETRACTLLQDVESFASLCLESDVPEDYADDGMYSDFRIELLSMDWSRRMGILVLTDQFLYLKRHPASPWYCLDLQDELEFGREDADDESSPVLAVSWCPDGESVMFTITEGVSVWNTKTRDFTADFLVDPCIRTLPRLSPDGRTLALLTEDALILNDLDSEQLLQVVPFKGGQQPLSMAWSACGDKLMLVSGDIWTVLCFGRQPQMLQQADHMAGLLKQVGNDTGSEPELTAMQAPRLSKCCCNPDHIEELENETICKYFKQSVQGCLP